MGLLEERERAARQRVEVLQAELGEAEAVWERFVIARETVGQILAEPRGSAEDSSLAGAGERPVQVAAAGPGSVVPVRRDGLEADALAPGYRRIMEILQERGRSGGGAMDCRQLAVALGLEPVPAKVEGVRSKTKRLAVRGWLAEASPGMFSVVGGRGGGS